MQTRPQPIFELCSQTLAETMPDVFGVWTTAPLPAGSALAFAASAEPDAELPAETSVWRANFPADARLAAIYLQNAEAQVKASRQGIQTAPQRIETFVQKQTDSASFDIISSANLLTESESGLAAMLQALQSGDVSVSFGWGVQLSGAWQGAAERFKTFMDLVLKSFLYYTWVETCCEQQCLARTGVSWTGDIATVWRQGLTTRQIQLHQRHVVLALTSRAEFVHTFVTVVQCAVRLAMLFNMPGKVLQLLPAVWKFINQILADK
jgi:hypothetical protein